MRCSARAGGVVWCATLSSDQADGYARGESCGAVVLTLESAEAAAGGGGGAARPAWAHVRATAINQDGRSAPLRQPDLACRAGRRRRPALNSRTVAPASGPRSAPKTRLPSSRRMARARRWATHRSSRRWPTSWRAPGAPRRCPSARSNHASRWPRPELNCGHHQGHAARWRWRTASCRPTCTAPRSTRAWSACAASATWCLFPRDGPLPLASGEPEKNQTILLAWPGLAWPGRRELLRVRIGGTNGHAALLGAARAAAPPAAGRGAPPAALSTQAQPAQRAPRRPSSASGSRR
jgi:hypothetical protein